MNIKDININDLKEYENNPRHNEAAVDKVVESIKEFGFKVPIIIDQNNVIITGHTRIKAAKKLGLKKVPCIIADDLSPEQIKAFRLADNKVSEYATWDEDKLYTELMELKIVNFDIESFGFDIKDIKQDEFDITPDDFGTDFELPSNDKEPIQTITFTFHDNQVEIVLSVIDYVLENNLISETFGNENKKGNAIYEVVKQWAELKNLL